MADPGATARRVLLVANTLPPADLSGVGEQVLQLAAGLRACGCEVTVLGRGPGGARGPKLLFPLMIVVPFLRAVRRLRPHVVQVHESDCGLAVLAARALWRRPAPLLVSLLQVSYREEIRAVRPLRAGDRILGEPGAVECRFRRFKAPLQVLLGRITARRADLVLAPSAATGAELERDYGARGVEVLPNATGGLDRPDPERAASDPADGYLLFVGRLRIRKGLEVLLEALAELPEARLLVAGDGEHRSALEATAARLALGERALFLGRCSRGRVRALLEGARALVVPSTYEGMPLVVLEAMEAGVPVVASRVSGIPEVVRDRVSGWLVPPEDPAALATALAEVCGDAAEARRRGQAGRERLEAGYRPRHVAARWLELTSGRAAR